jgi:hypothetical protein
MGLSIEEQRRRYEIEHGRWPAPNYITKPPKPVEPYPWRQHGWTFFWLAVGAAVAIWGSGGPELWR